MNDERGVLYLSFVLASIISDSDIYSDPALPYTVYVFASISQETLKCYKCYKCYHVSFTLIIAKSNIYEKNV